MKFAWIAAEKPLGELTMTERCTGAWQQLGNRGHDCVGKGIALDESTLQITDDQGAAHAASVSNTWFDVNVRRSERARDKRSRYQRCLRVASAVELGDDERWGLATALAPLDIDRGLSFGVVITIRRRSAMAWLRSNIDESQP